MHVASIQLSSIVAAVLTAPLFAAGCVAAGFALYLLLLSVAALFYRGQVLGQPPRARLDVLIPAHDESALIARCVRSLRGQAYPSELYRVIVVADNCSDDTAALASDAGADVVMTRNEPESRGKGRALRWAIDRLLADEVAADAIVVVDADSLAEPDFLARLVRPFEAGARAVQGESLLYPGDSKRAALRVSAFLLVNRVRPMGRAVLGLPATHLAGNGMLIARELLLARPWEAFTSAEDLEYSLRLQSEGVRIAFAGGAVLMSPAAPNAQAAAVQQLRWEGGKVYLARTELPRLLRRALRERRPGLLGVAFDLAVPPLGSLAVVAAGGSALSVLFSALGLMPAWALSPWLAAIASIPPMVVIGLKAGDAPKAGYLALLRAPLFLLAKPARMYRVLRFRGDSWVRTDRDSVSVPHAEDLA
ncbi:MAG: glycosyltransferase family 2 protein [Solirubrobacterales bacterium]|nr:glycosyltransferase family 2 protein [Solirubrobacterales bacterium]